MILLFLGSWRSTLIIAVSIPLSILASIIALSLLGETINIMTLGGLALAVGILVDDATVEIENINRNLEEGKPLVARRSSTARQQIAVPALVSTLCICIVFLPMFFLSGVARYLFVPLAEAVVFAMLASYLLSRTLVPTLAMYLLQAEATHDAGAVAQSAGPRVSAGVRARASSACATRYRATARPLLVRPAGRVHSRSSCCRLRRAFLLVPWLGQDFFPNTDSGQFILHLRAKTGTRIEETARLADLVEDAIRREIPAARAGHHPRQHRPAVQQHQLDAQHVRASSAPPTPTSSSRSSPGTGRPPTTSGALRRDAAARVPRRRPSTSCPPTSSPRS